MDFSLVDQLRACIPCARKPDVDSDDDLEAHRSGRPELDHLLFDSEHEATDPEADAMSLHSTIGLSSRQRRKSSKKRASGKSIRIFGYDLFGRPQPPEPSPPQSEDESSALVPPPFPNGAARPRTISGNSVDHDAAPIQDQTIATLSASQITPTGLSKWAAPLTDEQIAKEEDEQREKEERRARRAARRLRKQQQREAEVEAAADLAAGFGVPTGGRPADEPEFEGFPGGTATLAQDAAPMTIHPADDIGENDPGYGPYVQGSQQMIPPNLDADEQEESEDDVDVGGEYNRRSKKSGYSPRNSQSGSRSGGGSSSRNSYSKHSHSSSVVDGSSYAARRASRSLQPNAQHRPPYLPQNVPLPPSSAGSNYNPRPPTQKRNSNLAVELPPHFPSLSDPLKRGHGRQDSYSSAARSHVSSSRSNTSVRSPGPNAQNAFEVNASARTPQVQSTGVGVDSNFGEHTVTDFDSGRDLDSSSISNGFPSTGFGGRSQRSPFLNGQAAGSFANAS